MCYVLPECVGIASQILETSVQPLVDCTSNAHSLTLLLSEFRRTFFLTICGSEGPSRFSSENFFFSFEQEFYCSSSHFVCDLVGEGAFL
ncbi:Hypothetical protein J6896_03500 [Nakaseomyces glabratus]